MRQYAIARFKIKDFAQFKAEFEKVSPQLTQWGFSRTWLDRNVEDPNEIVVIHEIQDLERVHEFYASDEFRQCIRRAGVKGDPRVTFVEELARMPAMA